MILYSRRRFSYNMDIAGATRFLVSRKEVMTAGVRERILTVRLMERVKANPAVAEKLGIALVNGIHDVKKQKGVGKADNAETTVMEGEKSVRIFRVRRGSYETVHKAKGVFLGR